MLRHSGINDLSYKRPKIPCLHINGKYININMAVRRDNTKVCKL